VIVFMLVTYGRFGVYANLAVVLNIFVILAVMAMLNATLTLPGIAGFVLTIGTAVDANVLINERIREERRRGRNVIQAVELGYKEASRTIFEANVTHAISGLIMLLLGSGPVKGFAVVLLIGIATSVFTAVTFTRMMVALWLRARTAPPTSIFDRRNTMRLLKLVPDNTNLGFVSLRKWAFGLTMALLARRGRAGLGRGLNYGVDFVGGVMIEEKFAAAGPRQGARSESTSSASAMPTLQQFGDPRTLTIRLPAVPKRRRRRDQRGGQEGRGPRWRPNSPAPNSTRRFDRVGQGFERADP
jgi:preprotein translocase subunit SecF